MRRADYSDQQTDDNTEDQCTDRDRKCDFQTVQEPFPAVRCNKGLVQLEQQVPQTLRQIDNRIRYHFQPLVHCNTVHRSSPLSFHFTAKEGRR